jgi:hypothetical protein
MADRRDTVNSMGKSPGDLESVEALAEAERQMAEHEADLFDRLMEGVAAYVPQDLSAYERRHLVDGLIEANPELREVAQRLEIFERFRSASRGCSAGRTSG